MRQGREEGGCGTRSDFVLVGYASLSSDSTLEDAIQKEHPSLACVTSKVGGPVRLSISSVDTKFGIAGLRPCPAKTRTVSLGMAKKAQLVSCDSLPLLQAADTH